MKKGASTTEQGNRNAILTKSSSLAAPDVVRMKTSSGASTVCSRYITVIFLRITHERHPIVRPWGEVWGVDHECKVWLKFYDCNCCAMCTIEWVSEWVIKFNGLSRTADSVHYRVIYDWDILRVYSTENFINMATFPFQWRDDCNGWQHVIEHSKQ